MMQLVTKLSKNPFQVRNLKHYLSFMEQNNTKKKKFDGLDRYDQRKYPAKNRKLRENLKYW